MLFLTVLISHLLSGMCVDGGSVFNLPARLPVWGKTGLSSVAGCSPLCLVFLAQSFCFT